MKNLINNMTDYLQNNYFTNIKFINELNGSYYFTGTDEDDTTKQIEFQQENEKYIVSVRESENDKWTILEILSED